MEQRYFLIIRRWFWLILLAAIFTSGITYVLLRNQPPAYTAKARLIVGPGIDSPNPDLNDLRTGGQLMQTYAELATTRPVLESVIQELNLDLSPDDLKRKIKVKTDTETQILNIRVTDADPQLTADIANAVAESLVGMSPSGTDGPEDQIKQQIQKQAIKLEEDIRSSEALLAELEAKLQTTTIPAEERLILEQIAQERGRLTEARRTLATLYQTIQSSYTNQVKIIERAVTAEPVDANLRLTVLLAGMFGLMLALGIAFLFEYLDDTVKTPEELAHVTGIPLLGTISKYKLQNGSGPQRFLAYVAPDSAAAAAYQTIGTKLLLSGYVAKVYGSDFQAEEPPAHDGDEQPLAIPETNKVPAVLVGDTDADGDAGEVASNLAIALAQSGHRVVLVDANLHNPTIGALFGIAGQYGLSNLLVDTKSPVHPVPVDWMPGLSVLPAGPSLSNPFELLTSSRMVDIWYALKHQADIVIVAAAPLLSSADSLILASRVDGVVVTVKQGKISRTALKELIASLRTLNAYILGAVFDYNKASRTLLLPDRSTAQPMPAPTPPKESRRQEPREAKRRPLLKSLKL